MKNLKLLIVVLFTLTTKLSLGQESPAEMPVELTQILQADSLSAFNKLINKDNMNTCYTSGKWQYSLLSMTIRIKAKKCFDALISKGADVNKSCDGYVPPLMHAAKYGSLEMVKTLVAKGADVNYVYNGEYPYAKGKTPAQYAEENKQLEIAAYLKSKM